MPAPGHEVPAGGPVRLNRRMLLSAALAATAASCSSARTGPARDATYRPSAASAGSLATSAGQPRQAPPRFPAQVLAGPRNRQQVALTFHGAGAPSLTTALLGETVRAGAPVTVLAVGSWLNAYPVLAHRILDAGGELGNHTYSHPVLPRLGARDAYLEIARCAGVLRRLTGSPGRWFRPSGTPRATALIETAARRAGYPTCLGYDVDPRDYTDPGPAAVTSRVLAVVRPGSVISLHLGHRGTVEALPAILDGLRRAGLAPVTASILLGVPG